MIPASFEYLRARSVDEALALLAEHGDDAKLLAGGHSLLPAMKLRLSQPRVVVDIGRIAELRRIGERDGRLAIGALVSHAEIQSSELLRARCPLLPETAGQIGDQQVRNRGTIGGSLVHADPAADWPAAVLALDAEMEVATPKGARRTIRAQDFFVDLLQSALQPGEILTEVRVPTTGASAAYAKFAQKASGFAICGVAAVLDKRKGSAAVGITGVGPIAYRAKKVEQALEGRLSTDTIAAACRQAADRIECLADIHAGAEYRAHLASVYARRALEAALARG